jgi:uridine kinase
VDDLGVTRDRYARIAAELVRGIRGAGSAEPFAVLIDGGSGSGKSTLAESLVRAWPGEVCLVHLEDIYPGWGGLQAASEHVHDAVLQPLAAGGAPGWRRWDWVAGAPAGWNALDPGRPVIVEGSGSLSRQNRLLARFAVWLEADERERKRRALARDGDTYAPHWDEWALQERAFVAQNRPRELADVVIDTVSPRRDA